jgi:hypothetical protein
LNNITSFFFEMEGVHYYLYQLSQNKLVNSQAIPLAHLLCNNKVTYTYKHPDVRKSHSRTLIYANGLLETLADLTPLELYTYYGTPPRYNVLPKLYVEILGNFQITIIK